MHIFNQVSVPVVDIIVRPPPLEIQHALVEDVTIGRALKPPGFKQSVDDVRHGGTKLGLRPAKIEANVT